MSQAPNPSPASPSPQQNMQVQLELSPQLDAVYSNLALIQHSPSEFIVDFARVLPNMPTAKIGARIITTPMHAKLLLRALQDNINKYEAQFGPIYVPHDGEALASQLFRG